MLLVWWPLTRGRVRGRGLRKAPILPPAPEKTQRQKEITLGEVVLVGGWIVILGWTRFLRAGGVVWVQRVHQEGRAWIGGVGDVVVIGVGAPKEHEMGKGKKMGLRSQFVQL